MVYYPAIPFFDNFSHCGYVYPQICGQTRRLTDIKNATALLQGVVFLAATTDAPLECKLENYPGSKECAVGKKAHHSKLRSDRLGK